MWTKTISDSNLTEMRRIASFFLGFNLFQDRFNIFKIQNRDAYHVEGH